MGEGVVCNDVSVGCTGGGACSCSVLEREQAAKATTRRRERMHHQGKNSGSVWIADCVAWRSAPALPVAARWAAP